MRVCATHCHVLLGVQVAITLLQLGYHREGDSLGGHAGVQVDEHKAGVGGVGVGDDQRPRKQPDVDATGKHVGVGIALQVDGKTGTVCVVDAWKQRHSSVDSRAGADSCRAAARTIMFTSAAGPVMSALPAQRTNVTSGPSSGLLLPAPQA